MKAVSSYLMHSLVAARILDPGHVQIYRPPTSAKKQEHSDYIRRVFAILDSDPAAWNALESSSTGIYNQRRNIPTEVSQSVINSPRKLHVNAAAAPASVDNDPPRKTLPLQKTENKHSYDAAKLNAEHFPNTNISLGETSQLPTVEYWKGKELIDLLKYRNGIPPTLLNELQRISHYKGYPSKLRYEQVKIKQEPKHKSCTDDHLPRNETEVQIVNALRGMGFQDMQEIVTSMRHVQMENPLVQGEILIDMIMMHIVQQREENEESKKMDAARIQSEQSRILQETECGHDDCVQIVYSIEELLGLEQKKRWLFKDSFLLKSSKVRKLFYDLITEKKDENLLVQKMLTIEKKSRKWYGDTTEAFFRFLLCEKIEKWFDELANSRDTSKETMRIISQRLEAEISYIEQELYLVSDESEHIREPRLFKSARDVVKSRGLMTDVIHID